MYKPFDSVWTGQPTQSAPARSPAVAALKQWDAMAVGDKNKNPDSE